MLQKFFILCSGADRDILSTCSDGEKTKYVGIGATVFFTAIMAFLASSYGLFTVFDSIYPSVGFGIVWALLIFNLDRFIVSTIRKRDHKKQEFLQASPRIVLAIIIAIVISKPLEIKIFEKEINNVLLKEKNDLAIANKKQVTNYFTSDLKQNKNEIDSLKANLVQKEKEVNTYYATYIAEAEGTAGTKKMGKGPVFKEKIAKHDLAKKELDTLRKKVEQKIAEKEKKIKELNIDLDKKITDSKPIINSYDGLMARIKALGKLPWLPSFFIMLLFLAIETSPIIAKLLAPKGEYDFKLEEEESALQLEFVQNKHQRNLHQQTAAEITEKVYASLNSEEEVYKNKYTNAKDLLKHQSDNFYNKQKGIV